MHTSRLLFAIPFLVHCISLNCPAAQQVDDAKLDFNREIRPILAQYCFKCHGADEHAREGGFRLDQRDSATGQGDSGEPVIVPESPAASELMRRIQSSDQDLVMPPVHTKTTMPESAKKALEKWIAQGANYEAHWAYVAPNVVAIDALLTGRNEVEAQLKPIDFFIRRELSKQGLLPSPPADKYTLVRRVYLDLIGLPPTPAEADAFLADSSPDAYEQLVNRLLDSPRYGERWARRWLDLARYADTNGFEKDRPRSIWPYRDWVIRAINADMPYDQFSIKQLAGDLLPEATPDDHIATGFHRNTMLNEEGGIDPLEYRFYAMVDRVGVTGATWFGLTLNCVQCHTHKYDPIEHADFYRVMACLNNADEPSYYIPASNQADLERDYQQRLSRLAADLRAQFPGGEPELRPAFDKWYASESAQASKWQVVTPTTISTTLPHLELQPDGYLLGSGDITKSDVYDLHLVAPIEQVTAVKIEVASHHSLPNDGPGMTNYEGPLGGFFLSEIQFSQNEQPLEITAAQATNDKPIDDAGAANAGKKGQRKSVVKNSNAAAALDGEMSSGWQVQGGYAVSEAAVFRFDQPVSLAAGLNLKMLFEKHYACPVGHFRISVTTSDHPAATGQPTEIETLLAKSRDEINEDEQALLEQRFLETCPELQDASKVLWDTRRSPPRGQSTLVMQERLQANPRPTNRYHRGEFLQPREAVQPGVPGFLPQLEIGEIPARLAFARWLFTPENPLTARVTVNRHWQALFGRGLVKSLEDFGYQSEPPSHPQLLDWLALELVRNQWSIKSLHRLLVTSETYKQSSRVPPKVAELDPENIWLARGSRFRLDAEVIRDSALQAAGILSDKMGGPGVYPPQPASVTSEGTYGKFEWKPSEGEDRHRRTIYTFMKRTAPFAMSTTFDAPSGETCLARREVSNSPLQALTLLNDQMFVEIAQALATATQAADSEPKRIQDLFRRCLTRPATEAELKQLADFAQQQRSAGLSEPELWPVISRALMNLDEAITHP